MSDILALLARELSLEPEQARAAVRLLDEGSSVPFIARYRQEATGGLDDAQLRQLAQRLDYLRNLAARKEEVTRLLANNDLLTPQLTAQLKSAATLQEVEDIYRPFRPRRRTRATLARERGFEPLASQIMAQSAPLTPADLAAFVNPDLGLEDTEAVLAGAQDIIAEIIADDAHIRKIVRRLTIAEGLITATGAANPSSTYALYLDFCEPVAKIVPHRILALNRGEKEKVLTVRVKAPEQKILTAIETRYVRTGSPTHQLVAQAAHAAYKRLIAPSIEREIRSLLTERAENQALTVFARNLKNLLLAPPVRGKVVMGFDPAYRTGCKIAIVDPTGKLLAHAICYPTPPQNKIEEAKKTILALIQRYRVDVISLGNGTASRESERFLATVLKEASRPVSYTIVNEAGASVYSASELGSEEFPDLEASIRGAISIARRLQDPLAELVKVDPKSLGVGQYQHDVHQGKLAEKLAGVVESCVNSVGVDVNTASLSLLSYVSGITPRVGQNIIAYRQENGPLRSRQELLRIPRLGPKTFEQCAGFLRIPGSEQILDNTAVHPESYAIAERLMALYPLTELQSENFSAAQLQELAHKLDVGLPTIRDIIVELKKPGRDPREQLPPPVFRTDVLDLNDLHPGQILPGVVRNVTDFGAFIDIGVHHDGLAHISELSRHFIHSPLDVINVGDVVTVRVLSVEPERQRIALSLLLST